jgi:hypothetical protein
MSTTPQYKGIYPFDVYYSPDTAISLPDVEQALNYVVASGFPNQLEALAISHYNDIVLGTAYQSAKTPSPQNPNAGLTPAQICSLNHEIGFSNPTAGTSPNSPDDPSDTPWPHSIYVNTHYYNASGTFKTNTDVTYTVLHEIGHAVDDLLGGNEGEEYFSLSDVYERDYIFDLARLKTQDQKNGTQITDSLNAIWNEGYYGSDFLESFATIYEIIVTNGTDAYTGSRNLTPTLFRIIDS